MDVRAQISMVFHLDKCIGCHTCSISCKNIWSDREGTEYMWWNNVETKPGTGYPTQWEDQDKYKGGWEVRGGGPRLRATDKLRGFTNLFHQPHLPTIDDYYEPWTYRYGDLFDAPAGDDQPTARPISLVTGEPIDIEAGPNWDDDLGGSPVYAAGDPNLSALRAEERDALFQLQRMVFFYLPRICNHCLNPACVASCPSSALYKRGEDGIVLVNQDVCRGWRYCVSACPYKKVYYNWKAGKSEKCILCFPRLESGLAPACFHSCVGRIRYLGIVLYDAERIEEVAAAPESELVERQRALILDPWDDAVARESQRRGVHPSVLDAARRSPVYEFVKRWEMALPLHPEFRTMPMLFYVPPLLPVLASVERGGYDIAETDYFGSLEKARVPIAYMARLFAGGREDLVERSYRRLLAVRLYQRARRVGDVEGGKVDRTLVAAGIGAGECEEIYRLTSLPTFAERFVIPPMHREYAIELLRDPGEFKGAAGVGLTKEPRRGL